MRLFERIFGAAASHAPVSGSADLRRVMSLPRRPRPTPQELESLVGKWTSKLKKPDGPCLCQKVYNRACAKRLQPIQAWALEEASRAGGLLGAIPVGGGKSLLNLLVPMVVPEVTLGKPNNAVVLVPPGLKSQLLDVDWDFYAQHWKLPNLAGGFIRSGIPTIRVLSYSELSSAKSTDLLRAIRPDLFVCDEAHNLRNKTAARTKRFIRNLEKENPDAKLFCWSGTLTSRSISDYAHLAHFALHDGSPCPIEPLIVDEWGLVLDAHAFGSAGELERLANPGEPIRDAWNRRLADTLGVITSTGGEGCEASLELKGRSVAVPPEIEDHLFKVSDKWKRPDGEFFVDALAVARCMKQLSCGFFYRWRWPRGEPLEVRERWLEARAEWHKELRERLSRAGPHMDSPLLVTKAAIRWHDGFVHVSHIDGKHSERQEIPPYTKNAPLPTWASETWPRWRELRDTAKPETEPVWVSDFIVRDAVGWGQKNVGVIWYEHDAVGVAISKALGAPRYGAGEDAAAGIIKETGKRTVVASIEAHGTGRNLQMFRHGLVVSPPSAGKTWEQLLGRFHRTGQLADEVVFETYKAPQPFKEALDKALEDAEYVSATMGDRQKLLRASRINL